MSARQAAAAGSGGRTSSEGAGTSAGAAARGPGDRGGAGLGGTRAARSGKARLILAPGLLRGLVRRGEGGLVLLAAFVGCLAGGAVCAMSWLAQAMREAIYRLPVGTRLSAAEAVPPAHLLLGPCLGGVLLGLVILAANYLRGGPRRRPAVDPIEANALHGGRMSLRDSAYLALQNVISNGGGASVGLEAGYTQLASGLASRLGLAFELRRGDLRTLVGCGAAAAIAAAFGAPLTGAFYAFELIIGTYSIATLAPVVAAALCGGLVARALIAAQPLVDLAGGAHGAAGGALLAPAQVGAAEILPSLALGLACAGLGILIMRGVTLVERLVQVSGVPRAAAPALGGLCVGALALAASPQVLSGGHGALHLHFGQAIAAIVDRAAGYGPAALAGLLAAKAAASAISIGSGFRGGLFFASLFLGALAGELFAALVPPLAAAAAPGLGPALTGLGLGAPAYAVIGMSALAVAVVGGPLTMTFLALEATGSLPIAGLVLAAVIASSLTVRKTFGYSFATWRFHLRGESIRSAHDVGWIRTLTVGRLMRREVATVRLDTPLATFLRAHPLGSPSRVVAVDAAGRYAGIVLVPEAHAAAQGAGEAGEAAGGGTAGLAGLARLADAFLTSEMNAKEAMAAFDRTESEALAVLDGGRAVIGLLTESHALKRYSEELDSQRRTMAGETG